MKTVSRVMALILAALPMAAAAAAPVKPATIPATHSMVGLAPDQVRTALGEPDVAQADGAGALWTYRLDACALMIAFRDTAGALRVSDIVVGPRRRGETPPSIPACVASGEAAHRNPPPLPTSTPHR